MGVIHDAMATKCGDQVLNKIRSADPQYKQIFSTSLSRTSDWGWPRPDYVCFDAVNKCTYAIEFKPTNQTKREYLCGLGQSLAYLQNHMYSGLIVPTVADDGFQISSFINNTLQAPEFTDVGISLYEYDPKTLAVNILREIKTVRTVKTLTVTKPPTSTFWCWWREMSQYELFKMLSLSFKYNEQEGDIYTNNIFPEFWKEMNAGKALTWEGVKRKTPSTSSEDSLKQNYKIPLNQLDLWNPATGKLTETGMKLLKIGKMYGADSRDFLNALAYLVLVDGKHLELIKRVETYQKKNPVPNNRNSFLVGLENHLQALGCIGPRKPAAKKGTPTAKPSYVRDEPKLWNKLGLLEMKGKTRYFFPNEGFHFNWHVISDALIEGQRIMSE